MIEKKDKKQNKGQLAQNLGLHEMQPFSHQK